LRVEYFKTCSDCAGDGRIGSVTDSNDRSHEIGYAGYYSRGLPENIMASPVADLRLRITSKPMPSMLNTRFLF
jgi:hypothetical protein